MSLKFFYPRRFILAVVCSFVLLSIDSVSADGQTRHITKRVGTIALGWKYSPKYVTSFSDLPTDIARKVTSHLLDRLGEEFYSKLLFTSAVIVDLDELCRIDGCNYQWKVFSYKLEYAFSLPEIGIKRYEASIWLDKNGDVLKEIDLPAIRQNPAKANFISVKEAIAIGKKKKFKTSFVELAYREKEDSIVWKLVRNPSGPDGYTHQIEVSAHDGSVLNEVGWRGIF
jgi:hypothetical protein